MAIVFGILAFASSFGIQLALYNSMADGPELFSKSLNDPLRIVSAMTFGFSLVSLVIQAL